MDNIKLDKEFQGLIPPLSSEEFIGLEDSIQKEGCRDSLIVWNDILVDGHNRKLICDKYKLPYKTKESEFKDRNEVILWIIDNQLNRRNLTPFARTELNLKKESLISSGQGTRTDLSKDLPKFNARDDKVYQDIRREEKKEKIKLNPVKIPKGKIRDIESEWRKNEI